MGAIHLQSQTHLPTSNPITRSKKLLGAYQEQRTLLGAPTSLIQPLCPVSHPSVLFPPSSTAQKQHQTKATHSTRIALRGARRRLAARGRNASLQRVSEILLIRLLQGHLLAKRPAGPKKGRREEKGHFNLLLTSSFNQQ